MGTNSSDAKQPILRRYPSIGVCGLDCGLCPHFYTEGDSRCPGCCGKDFFNKHPSCGFITCCVKKKGVEVCALCEEFPCTRFKDVGNYDSFVTYRNVMITLDFIKKHGIEKYYSKQKERMALLVSMLETFNDGRKKSFYCIACSLLSVEGLKNALTQALSITKEKKIKEVKEKAKVLKTLLDEASSLENVELSLRKK